jgi:hypothetical protein
MTYPRKKPNWPALRAEWLSGNESLTAFKMRHGITHSARWMSETAEWKQAKAAIVSNAEAQTGDAITKQLVKRWGVYRELLDDCLTQAKTLSKKKKPTPAQLSQLSTAIEKLLKSDSFLHGGPTERVENKGDQPVTHSMMVALLKALEAKDPRVVLPETVIDAEIVDGPPNDI